MIISDLLYLETASEESTSVVGGGRRGGRGSRRRTSAESNLEIDNDVRQRANAVNLINGRNSGNVDAEAENDSDIDNEVRDSANSQAVDFGDIFE